MFGRNGEVLPDCHPNKLLAADVKRYRKAAIAVAQEMIENGTFAATPSDKTQQIVLERYNAMSSGKTYAKKVEAARLADAATEEKGGVAV